MATFEIRSLRLKLIFEDSNMPLMQLLMIIDGSNMRDVVPGRVGLARKHEGCQASGSSGSYVWCGQKGEAVVQDGGHFDNEQDFANDS